MQLCPRPDSPSLVTLTLFLLFSTWFSSPSWLLEPGWGGVEVGLSQALALPPSGFVWAL